MKNIFEKKFFGNDYVSKKMISPCRDWLVLLILFFVMVIISVVFDFLTYQKIVRGEMYVSVEKNELTFISLEREKIKNIFDKFQEKKKRTSEMKVESLIDPSI